MKKDRKKKYVKPICEVVTSSLQTHMMISSGGVEHNCACGTKCGAKNWWKHCQYNHCSCDKWNNRDNDTNSFYE